MQSHSLFVGNLPLTIHHHSAEGQYVEIEGEKFYKIFDFDKMPPFFMSIVSDSDHWLFISSKGGLTAGRKNPENAFFPYTTDDKIHDSSWNTGSRTIIWVEQDGKKILWEPFGDRYYGIYSIRRHIYKNIPGNKIIFEEINETLQLSFQYSWLNSQKFGFIKKSKISNLDALPVGIHILDGIQNLLPACVSRAMQTHYSTLVDAYKKNEFLADSGMGIYSLSSIPVDRAEPSESLKATVVWSLANFSTKKLLSSSQLESFRSGQTIQQEEDIRALPCAYFIHAQFELKNSQHWVTILDGNKDSSDISALKYQIQNNPILETDIDSDIELGTDNLIKIVANADGLQLTADQLNTSRHFSNVLFNVMRGGIFDNNYSVKKCDFILFFKNTNTRLFEKHTALLDALPNSFQYFSLIDMAVKTADRDLERICHEYLPLTFSRRHGDPSRPWNTFSIDIQKEDGSKVLNYQGNWRDIFQNWEALSLSFPGFIESMICKFVNASTADGYNPYRVTRNGFEWEIPDENDPWSYIGYWGDHQIIYLLKLLEVSKASHPGKLDNFLGKAIFSYANVPYRIKPYAALLATPQDTIVFDTLKHKLTQERKTSIGNDGQLIWTTDGKNYLVNLTEKLLVTLLTKFSNFIPEAGIWMNTQRPEWNDANNALVGRGVSMVTLYYMHRFLEFFMDILKNSSHASVSISSEVYDLFCNISQAFHQNKHLLNKKLNATERKNILDVLGQSGEIYREKIYTHGFTGSCHDITLRELIDFCQLSIDYIHHSIRANKRDDQLYNAYNLMQLQDDGIGVRFLYEMLEGQVALISSGSLSAAETLELLETLKASHLYRQDQNSYMLYPDRQLPLFVKKNMILSQDIHSSQLLKKLIENQNQQIIIKDIDGHFHFHSSFRNVTVLREALESLKNTEYKNLVEEETDFICAMYESVFNHSAFTGRSGTFYKYEGLGCIYWHMVAKLLPAIKDIYFASSQAGADQKILSDLVDVYYEIREGLGVHKPPQLYGAFPTDPYSHTPGHLGVQQPGMTGQVKEDIISRFAELGVCVENGKIIFRPHLLRKSEFLTQAQDFTYYDVQGHQQTRRVNHNMLAFTYCQVPVFYHLAQTSQLVISKTDASITKISGWELDTQTSCEIFNRTNIVNQIDVYMNL
jgi:hypothetical protein